MKILLSNIQDNPHRNMTRNPILPEHVNTLVESIKRNDWGENVIVRPHPTEEGQYQLAYGHNRLAALRKMGFDKAEFIVKEVSDWGMLGWMVDENESQRRLTPEIIYENIESGINYLEPIIQASETIEDFNLALQICNTSSCSQARSAYTDVRNNVLIGEGIGARFLAKVLPGDKSTNINNIQTVISSHYQVARSQANDKRTKAAKIKAGAKRKAATLTEDINKARDLEAEAAAHDAEADALEKDAAKLKAVASQDVLLQFPNAAKMTAFAEAVKRDKIPADRHQQIVDHVLDTANINEPAVYNPIGSHMYKRAISAWWYKASGKNEKDRAKFKRESFKAKHQDVSLDAFAGEIPPSIRALILRLDAVTPFTDQMENAVLNGNLVLACNSLIDSTTALRDALNVSDCGGEVAPDVPALPLFE